MCTHEAYYTLLFCTLETMLLWWREEHIFTQIFLDNMYFYAIFKV